MTGTETQHAAQSLLPLIRQFHDAGSDRARASLLLRLPDGVLAKHAHVFEAACRRAGFEAGLGFIDLRRVAWLAVRDELGRLPAGLEIELARWREQLAAYAEGGGGAHKLPISPLVGEMPGKAEGGAVPPASRSFAPPL